MKQFYCGFCKDKAIPMTRAGLRIHLREHVRDRFTNWGPREEPNCRKSIKRQEWWIVEEMQ